MKKNGCIERVYKNIVYGWYYFEKTQVVFAYYKDQLIGKSFALEKRIDLNNPHAHSFKIDCGTFAEDLLINIENLKIKSDVDDEIIEIYKVVKMASDIAKLSNDELKIFKRSLPDNFINILYDNEMKNFNATRLKNSLAVVAYANDANAWFPYFYSNTQGYSANLRYILFHQIRNLLLIISLVELYLLKDDLTVMLLDLN